MFSAVTKEKLAEKLVESGRLSKDRLQEIIREAQKHKQSFLSLLVLRGNFKEEDILEFFSEQLNIPLLHLQNLRVPKQMIKLVPRKIVEKYQIFPLSRIEQLLTVATYDPFELILQDDLKELTGCDVVFVLASAKSISTAIDAHYNDSGNMETILEGIDDENLEWVKEQDKNAEALKGDGKTRSNPDDAPVVRMVNLILDEGIRSRASDIHFEPYEKIFRVRYRIDGALRESFENVRDLYTNLVARVKIMAQLNITEKRLPQDGRFRVSIRGKEVDFRVSILPTYHGEKIVLRILDRSGLKSGLDQLGFSEKPTSIFAEAIKFPYGMILVTGPTGSGKSTTLYTILNTMNTLERNIMTVEDPVEYQVEGITQTQVNSEVGLSFAAGLRSLLRQSPDIVLVGEIRDTETADIAVKAALTGHLVFSTLHTNSACGAMTRLIDMGVQPFLIASSVICVAAQRLMKKICPHCKIQFEIDDSQMRRCKLTKKDFEGFKAYKGAGCAKCNQTGYYGRLGAIEVLRVDPEIRELVVQRKSSDVIERCAIAKGMETLFWNAFGLFKKGLTTLDEVLRVSSQE